MPPRSSTRPRTETPSRAVRAATVTLQRDTTPAKRSVRAASRPVAAANDSAQNPALPQLQTQQSYAYGSSKTPVLPEQIHARDVSMLAVANRLTKAAAEAERNFQAQAAELRVSTPESQSAARDTRAQRRASKGPVQSSPPTFVETPVIIRKHDRTVNWINSSQPDIISEEETRQAGQEAGGFALDQDRAGSEPSSFPDGSFSHSYNYERGERSPELPQPELQPQVNQSFHRIATTRPQISPGLEGNHARESHARLGSSITKVKSAASAKIKAARVLISRILSITWHWLGRVSQMMQKALQDIPDSPVASALFKTLLMIAVVSLFGFTFCTIFTYTCNPGSMSIISQSLQRVCGECTNLNEVPLASWNITAAHPNDLNSLIFSLKQTQNHIAQIEARLSSRIDVSHASHTANTAALRSHQEKLELQIRNLKKQQPSLDRGLTSNGIPSPLIAQLNFFSPTSGAIIIPHLTSPTLSDDTSLVYRVLQRSLSLRKTLSRPIAALQSWLDEGDCWCASAVPSKDPGQDSVRLAVRTLKNIYPTELVIEHFPSSGSLAPGTAPRNVELWADFSDLSYAEAQQLHIRDLIAESGERGFLGNSKEAKRAWARIGTVTYAVTPPAQSRTSSQNNADDLYGFQEWGVAGEKRETEVRHVQRFSLQINQHGMLHYSDRFLVRVRSNYGADHTCLYRVRLHGALRNDGDSHKEDA